MRSKAFISRYGFVPDTSKPGRVLETGKIGDVYITRLTIEPGTITGNVYHKKTDLLFFVTKGKVQFRFVQVYTGEQDEFVLDRTGGIIHVPAGVAIASKNISDDIAIVVYFSNKPFRGGDDYPHDVYPVTTKEV